MRCSKILTIGDIQKRPESYNNKESPLTLEYFLSFERRICNLQPVGGTGVLAVPKFLRQDNTCNQKTR